MKRLFATMMAVVMYVSMMCGCAAFGNKETPEETVASDIQWLVDTYGFSTGELEKVDVEKLIDNYDLKNKSDEYTSEQVHEFLYEHMDLYELPAETESVSTSESAN